MERDVFVTQLTDLRTNLETRQAVGYRDVVSLIDTLLATADVPETPEPTKDPTPTSEPTSNNDTTETPTE